MSRVCSHFDYHHTRKVDTELSIESNGQAVLAIKLKMKYMSSLKA